MEYKLATHKFKLTSGVECEVKEYTGAQQEILTKQDGRPHTDKLADMIRSILVRIGSRTDFTLDFIKNDLLGSDKKHILTESRQFSLGHQNAFELPFKYVDQNGIEQTEPVNVNLPDAKFPVVPLKVEQVIDEKTGEKGLIAATYTEYEDIVRKDRITLAKTGIEVEWTLLDGKGERIGFAKKKKERSTNTLIEMRRPVYFELKTDGQTPVPISLSHKLSSLPLSDIEQLRKRIKDVEGDVNTEVVFEHPEADSKAANEKIVRIDVLNEVVFFFPSGAI